MDRVNAPHPKRDRSSARGRQIPREIGVTRDMYLVHIADEIGISPVIDHRVSPLQ